MKKNKPYRMMLSDLDETLLLDYHVPEVNRISIRKAREMGLKFIPATGRAFNMIPEILREIGTYEEKNEYSICFNGALIVENRGARILNFVDLPHKAGEILFREAVKRELCFFVFTPDCCHIHNGSDYEIRRKERQDAPHKVMTENDFSYYHDKKIAKIMFMRQDMPYLLSLREELLLRYAELRELTELSFSSGRYMECTAKGIDKGFALRWLANYLEIDLSETIAIGDSYNDLPMIEAAGLGACVSSSADEIKSNSEYVCEKDYGDGAVSEVIERFVIGC